MIFDENHENLRIASDRRIDLPHPIAIAIGCGVLAERLDAGNDTCNFTIRLEIAAWAVLYSLYSLTFVSQLQQVTLEHLFNYLVAPLATSSSTILS